MNLRFTVLFGKEYWWDRDTDGRLALRPAPWAEATPEPAPDFAAVVATIRSLKDGGEQP